MQVCAAKVRGKKGCRCCYVKNAGERPLDHGQPVNKVFRHAGKQEISRMLARGAQMASAQKVGVEDLMRLAHKAYMARLYAKVKTFGRSPFRF